MSFSEHSHHHYPSDNETNRIFLEQIAPLESNSSQALDQFDQMRSELYDEIEHQITAHQDFADSSSPLKLQLHQLDDIPHVARRLFRALYQEGNAHIAAPIIAVDALERSQRFGALTKVLQHEATFDEELEDTRESLNIICHSFKKPLTRTMLANIVSGQYYHRITKDIAELMQRYNDENVTEQKQKSPFNQAIESLPITSADLKASLVSYIDSVESIHDDIALRVADHYQHGANHDFTLQPNTYETAEESRRALFDYLAVERDTEDARDNIITLAAAEIHERRSLIGAFVEQELTDDFDLDTTKQALQQEFDEHAKTHPTRNFTQIANDYCTDLQQRDFDALARVINNTQQP